jgi:hypothetical protein
MAAVACGAIGVGLATSATAADVKSIAILTPEEPTDFGWNQQGHDAAKAVAEKYGLEFMPATGLGYGDVHPQLRELADDGASLMIAHASGYNTAAPEIGAEKGVPVAIVDKPDANKKGLVADHTLSGHQGAYLAGHPRRTKPRPSRSASSCRAAAVLELPVPVCAGRQGDGWQREGALRGDRSRRLFRCGRWPPRHRVCDRRRR